MLKRISKFILLFLVSLSLFIPSAAYCSDDTKTPAPIVKYQVDGNHPPFEIASKNDIHGFGMDLGRLIFSSGNYDVNYSYDVWDRVYQRIRNNEIDVCGLVAINEERKKEILFSKPVIKTYRAIYTRKNMTIKSVEEIKQYKIGVQKSDMTEYVLKNNLKITNYQTFNDIEEVIAALQQGKVDVLFGNQEVTNYFLVKNQLEGTIVPQIINLYPVDLAFGISRNKPELVKYINRQLILLQSAGLYEQVYQKYFFRHSEAFMKNKQNMVIAILIFLTLIVIASILFVNALIRHLKKTVDKATNSLKEEHELLRITLSSIGDGVIATNAKGDITFMNHVAELLTGVAEKDSVGKPISEALNIIDTENGLKYDIPVEDVLANNSMVNFNDLYMLVSEEGSQHLILGSASPVRSNDGQTKGVLVVFQDISEKKIAEETIKYHEYYDSLTDLPNRKLFHEYLNTALENAYINDNKLAVLIIDLDYFKNINDTLGHHIGDKLLQQVSRRLVKVLNQNDVLARMGGDEFTVLMPQIHGAEQAYRLARKVLEMLGQIFNIDEHELYVTASIGVAIYPNDGSESSVIMKHADMALYTAKENGRNTYQSYVVVDDEKVIEKFSLTKDLRTAIERNEMTLYYQPKVDSATGEVIGMEALVRWMHPERGIISPGVFIPIAEETGIIRKLDEWVLRTACIQFKNLTGINNKPMRLSVNLSAYQFRHHNLVDTIAQVLVETGFEPHLLELEITETTAMENIDFTIKTLKKLNEMGVNISIDDFGTGYSSLNYLRTFPIHLLKIDRSFVSDMIKNTNTKAIVKSIIDVAHSLKLKVTAEGVETVEQLTLLKQMSCDELQGYLISKPLPLNELKKNMPMLFG
ncbi:MAG: EAL domain-containing protein [Caulobacteraceae bacterium]